MPLDKQLMGRIRGLDDYDLRRLLIFVKGLLVTRGDPPDPAPATGSGKPPAITYRLESVACGKPGCTKCPHGPYWYAYWRESGRVRSRYIGKKLPASVKAAADPASPND